MKQSMPTTDMWRDLYDVALRVKACAPWDWMTETDIFGVQDPKTKEPGFVSVMGMAGEHFAVSLYLGTIGLFRFNRLQEMASEDEASFDMATELLETPQLQASFEDRAGLHRNDLDIIKALGLKFRGSKEWPQFRSYRPGYFPWFLDADEVRFLTVALDQIPDVAVRFRTDPDVLGDDDTSYLIRVHRQRRGQVVWEDAYESVPMPAPIMLEMTLDVDMLETLSKKPQSHIVLEIDCFMMPSPVRDGGERPYYPYAFMAVDAKSAMILGHEILSPVPTLEAMWSQIPGTLIELLSRIGVKPKEIRVSSPLVYGLLEPVAESARIKLTQADRLPFLDDAREAMLQWLGGGS